MAELRSQADEINQQIFDTTLDLILVCTRYGIFTRVSPSCEQILGYHPRDMIGHVASEFLFPPDLENTRKEMRSARRGKLTRHFECRYVHKNGSVVTLDWTGVWVPTEQLHFFIGRDISALKIAVSFDTIRDGQLTGIREITTRIGEVLVQVRNLGQEIKTHFRQTTITMICCAAGIAVLDLVIWLLP